MYIKISKGLDIPIKGKPTGTPHPFVPAERVALELSAFTDYKFQLLVKPQDFVKIGEPLAVEKEHGIAFVSPASGFIEEIRRGLKRALLAIVIRVQSPEEWVQLPPITSPEEILTRWKEHGGFSHIRKRPFNVLTTSMPRAVFIKAIESSLFTPPPDYQVKGHEALFQAGLDSLKKATNAPLHLVVHKNTTCQAFLNAQNVTLHTAKGPHPIGNFSLHIQEIDPIKSPSDCLWTLNVHDVITLGSLVRNGRYFIDRIVGIGGPDLTSFQRGFYQLREGYPIKSLLQPLLNSRLISGDPLTGFQVTQEDYLGFNDYAFSVIPENTTREFLHFFRLGARKYSFSRAYLSGHLPQHDYPFTTNQHGEKRPFIDSSLYDKVMPLHIPVIPLMKAVLAQDYDLAEQLGLYSVDSEDFALPSFVCPSKIEMTEIIKNGLKEYQKQLNGK